MRSIFTRHACTSSTAQQHGQWACMWHKGFASDEGWGHALHFYKLILVRRSRRFENFAAHSAQCTRSLIITQRHRVTGHTLTRTSASPLLRFETGLRPHVSPCSAGGRQGGGGWRMRGCRRGRAVTGGGCLYQRALWALSCITTHTTSSLRPTNQKCLPTLSKPSPARSHKALSTLANPSRSKHR